MRKFQDKFFENGALIRSADDTELDNVDSANYRFYVRLNSSILKSNWSRDRLVAQLQEAGIQCSVGSCCEIYLEEAFAKAGLHFESLLTRSHIADL